MAQELDMKVLLIEDDLDIGAGIQKALSTFSFDVVWIRTLVSAMRYAESSDFDLAVLDLGLPDGDGLAWLKSLRQRGEIQPVLVLSARDALKHRLEGLESGADDFLVKPFELEELVARLRAMERRLKGFRSGQLTVNRLTLDEQGMKVSLGGSLVRLSPTEYRIAQTLVKRLGRVVPRTTLEMSVSDDESNSLDMHISNLRKKLGRGDIRTVRGIGYVIDSDAFS
ncbi:MAG: response regulator transcription factor [Burkholderiaceae bacterium]